MASGSAPIVAPALAAQPDVAGTGQPAPMPAAAPAPIPGPGVAPQPAATPSASAHTSVADPAGYGSGDARYGAYPPPYDQRQDYEQRMRYRGVYVQPRIMGMFGVNFPHAFAESCPGSSCELDSPAGFGGGALVGWGFRNTGIHLLVMGMFDQFGADVELPPEFDVDGGASGGAGGGFDIDIGDDGVSIDGDLFGGGSGSGSVLDDEEPGDAHATRSGVAFGAGVQQAWFRRPVRLTTGLSAGVVRRTVKGTSSTLDSQAEYTAPFVMGDVGFAFGRRKAFMIGAMAFVEFMPKVRLDRNGVFRNVPVITRGPQVFVGPYIAVQWGPRGRPVEPHEQYDEAE